MDSIQPMINLELTLEELAFISKQVDRYMESKNHPSTIALMLQEKIEDASMKHTRTLRWT